MAKVLVTTEEGRVVAQIRARTRELNKTESAVSLLDKLEQGIREADGRVSTSRRKRPRLRAHESAVSRTFD